MKVLFGDYAVYNGKEYDATGVCRGGIFLKSDDEIDREKGFEYDKDIRRYILFVTPEAIEQYFRRTILCKYRGYECSILSEEGATYRLWLKACPPEEIRKTFERVDKLGYEKTVDKSEVEDMRYKIAEYDLNVLRSEKREAILREYVISAETMEEI